MGSTLTYKILKSHLVEGKLEKGKPIAIRIDQTLTQDATGTMAYLEFEAMGLDKVQNELAVSYVDHNTVQVGFENADDHEYLRTVAAKKGVVFSRPGNGICHQVHLERFGAPGKTSLGSDSHTPTGGGLGMISIGAGGLDVALAMAGKPFNLIAPKVVAIKLYGALRPWVSAKDVILKVLEKFGVKGNVNTVFEYIGDGVKTLTVPERATICNMGAECGVTTSIFPSDEETEKFLFAQERGFQYILLSADDDCVYDDIFEINLSSLEPMVALPHSPGNVVPLKTLVGMEVNQVLIGSCTNSSYTDMVKVGQILTSHTIAPNVSLGIAPGSREVLMMITEDGTLTKMLHSGARILESACGFCIGNHQSPGSKGISLRTSNRNFEGRSGTKDAQLYLVSPEVAALASLYGYVVDPLTVTDIKAPRVDMPEHFLIDDSMFIYPPKESDKVVIARGPNIGEPPLNVPMTDSLSGIVSLKVGDKITTDHIMPAGARLKYRSNIKTYATFVFEGVDNTFPSRSLKLKEEGKSSFIIAGASYGQGSSREHAAICPMYLGVKAVIAISIERIHQANLCNFGILPLTFKNEEDYQKIEQGDELELCDIFKALDGDEIFIMDKSKGISIPLVLDITPKQAKMIKAGGELNLIKGEING